MVVVPIVKSSLLEWFVDLAVEFVTKRKPARVSKAIAHQMNSCLIYLDALHLKDSRLNVHLENVCFILHIHIPFHTSIHIHSEQERKLMSVRYES
jgi:hypothetical protein